MKQQHGVRISLSWLIAGVAFASGMAGAAGPGDVQTGARSVTAVYGRSSATPDTGTAAGTLRSGSPAASEVLGRGNARSDYAASRVWVNAGNVNQVYGRSSGSEQNIANSMPILSNDVLAVSK